MLRAAEPARVRYDGAVPGEHGQGRLLLGPAREFAGADWAAATRTPDIPPEVKRRYPAGPGPPVAATDARGTARTSPPGRPAVDRPCRGRPAAAGPAAVSPSVPDEATTTGTEASPPASC